MGWSSLNTNLTLPAPTFAILTGKFMGELIASMFGDFEKNKT
jgi:hypothetical protein